MSLYKWSQNPAENATADPSINYQEGQAPSTLNDSARAAMAAMAKFRDDISGGTVTDGTSTGTNYVVFTSQGFDSLTHLNDKAVALTPSITNTGAVQVNVDSLGPKPFRPAPNIEFAAGMLIAGTPYTAVYNSTDGVYYMSGYFVQPSLIMVGASVDFWGVTLPNTQFAFLAGQAISRSTYAALFALIGTTHGVGDGSTTFNLPDCRGRVTAAPDNNTGIGTDQNRLTNGALASVRNSIGGAGGESGHTLAATEIPAITTTTDLTFSLTVTSNSSNVVVGNPLVINLAGASSPITAFSSGGAVAQSITSTGTVPRIPATSNNTGGQPHNNMQPTILCNKIIRVL